ncbi:MAG: hypothetical protein WCK02_16475 [Bacteroidota bacterium]
MKKNNFFILIALVAVISSCQKQPEASFTTDKSSYMAGEVVRLTNTSMDADSYVWTTPDGQVSTSANVNFTSSDSWGACSKVFKLEAFSKNGKKTDVVTKVVSFTEAIGKVSFWNVTSDNIVNVTINNITKSITGYDQPTNCESFSGCANFSLTYGSYYYTATDGTINWDGIITIDKECQTMQLYSK